MNPLKKLAGQTAVYGLSTIVGRLLNYLLVPLYTYHFSTSQYGTITEMYAYVSFLLIVLTYGMETALFNFSVSETDKNKVYTTILVSVIISSAVFIAGAWLLRSPVAGLIRYPDHTEYITWFALILGTDAVSAIAFAKLREQNKAARFAIIKIINIGINIGLNLFFIVYCSHVFETPRHPLYSFVKHVYDPSIGIGYAFISNLVASLLTLVLLLPDIFGIRFRFDNELWKRMMRYALPLLVAGLAGMINETLDRILLKYILPENIANAQNGIYGACYKVSIIMTMFIQTFRFAAEPFFFSHSREQDSRKIYADVMKYFVIICAVIFLGTMMNMAWIKYFVGKEFRVGLKVVPILLLANLSLGVFFNLSIWYKLTGQTRFGAYLTVYGALVTLAGNFIFIPYYGYMASAWTTLVCYATMMVLSYFIGNKHYPVDYDLKRILGYLSISVFLYLISTFIKTESTVTSLFINNLLLVVFLGFVFLLERKKFKLF